MIDLEELEAKAYDGDLDAAKKLYEYYSKNNDIENIKIWRDFLLDANVTKDELEKIGSISKEEDEYKDVKKSNELIKQEFSNESTLNESQENQMIKDWYDEYNEGIYNNETVSNLKQRIANDNIFASIALAERYSTSKEEIAKQYDNAINYLEKNNYKDNKDILKDLILKSAKLNEEIYINLICKSAQSDKDDYDEKKTEEYKKKAFNYYTNLCELIDDNDKDASKYINKLLDCYKYELGCQSNKNKEMLLLRRLCDIEGFPGYVRIASELCDQKDYSINTIDYLQRISNYKGSTKEEKVYVAWASFMLDYIDVIKFNRNTDIENKAFNLANVATYKTIETLFENDPLAKNKFWAMLYKSLDSNEVSKNVRSLINKMNDINDDSWTNLKELNEKKEEAKLNELVASTKDLAKNEIDDIASIAKSKIEKLNLPNEDVENLIKQVNVNTETIKNEMDLQNSLDDIEKIKDKAKSYILNVFIESKINICLNSLTESVEETKKSTSRLKGLTDIEKNAAYTELDELLNEQKEAINNATNERQISKLFNVANNAIVEKYNSIKQINKNNINKQKNEIEKNQIAKKNIDMQKEEIEKMLDMSSKLEDNKTSTNKSNNSKVKKEHNVLIRMIIIIIIIYLLLNSVASIVKGGSKVNDIENKINAVNNKEKIKLEDYIKVTIKGQYKGYAVAEVSYDEEGLIEMVESINSNASEYKYFFKNLLNNDSITYSINKSEYLTNGDVVEVKVEANNKEVNETLKSLGISLKGFNKKIEVKGLVDAEGTGLDPFSEDFFNVGEDESGVRFIINGYAPCLLLYIENGADESDPRKYINYYINGKTSDKNNYYGYLRIGDTIEITADLSEVAKDYFITRNKITFTIPKSWQHVLIDSSDIEGTYFLDYKNKLNNLMDDYTSQNPTLEDNGKLSYSSGISSDMLNNSSWDKAYLLSPKKEHLNEVNYYTELGWMYYEVSYLLLTKSFTLEQGGISTQGVEVIRLLNPTLSNNTLSMNGNKMYIYGDINNMLSYYNSEKFEDFDIVEIDISYLNN